MKKYALPMVVIVGGGFLLWNLAFVMLAGIAALERLVFRTGEMGATYGLARGIFLVLILLTTYLIFRTKFPDFIKATVLTVPMISILVLIGMKCYMYPMWVSLIIGGGFLALIAFVAYLAKAKWVYYFATAYVGIIGLMIAVFQIEI